LRHISSGYFFETSKRILLFFLFLFIFSSQVFAAVITWDGGGSTSNWSDNLNWSSDTTPESHDTAVFSDTSTKNSTIDAAFSGQIGNIIINTGYTGAISQVRNITVFGSFEQLDGTFTSEVTKVFSVEGSFSIPNAPGAFSRFSGSGTSGSPYAIYDIYGLQAVNCYKSASFEVANDINAAPTRNWNYSGTSYEGFVPIGTIGAGLDLDGYSGGFNGNNKTVNGLWINRPGKNHVGLFGYILTANISNLSVVNSNIVGNMNVGGFAGRSEFSYITNCSSEANIYSRGISSGGLVGYFDGISIESCSSSGILTSEVGYAGGLIGGSLILTKLTNSHSSVNVNAGNSKAGGLIGGMDGAALEGYRLDFSNCYATGSVRGTSSVGGLIGYSVQILGLDHCSASGEVYGSGNYVGGLIGYFEGAVSTIESCTATGNVSADGQDAGGLVGKSSLGTTGFIDIRNCYATGRVYGNAANGNVGGLVGYADQYNNIVNCSSSSRVYGKGANIGGLVGFLNNNSLISNSTAIGAVTSESSNVGGLVGYTNTDTLISYSYATGNVFSTNQSYSAVGGLVGQTNWGSYIYNSHASGNVFGYLDVGGLVGSNSGNIVRSYATGTPSFSGFGNVGGLVGTSGNGLIYKCYATGSVTRTDTNGNWNIGGLVGNSSCTIENSCAFGNISDLYGGGIGGLVGQNTGLIKNCYASGNISSNGGSIGGLVGQMSLVGGKSGTIQNCYSRGRVQASNSAGGLIGDDSSGTGIYINSYYDTQTSGKTDTGKGTPVSTALMKKKATFTAWDFYDAWTIDENKEYPQLAWQDYSWTGANDNSWTNQNNWEFNLERFCGYPRTKEQKAFIGEGSSSIALNVSDLGGLQLGTGYSGTLTLSSDLSLDDSGTREGGFVLGGGTLDLGSYNLIIDGRFLRNASATFANNNGAIYFTGSASSSIEGNTSFKRLSCVTPGKTLVFESGSISTIEAGGFLTFEGNASSAISLKGSSSLTKWKINPLSTREVSYCVVSDSDNVSDEAIVATHSVNRSNNMNWVFDSYMFEIFCGPGGSVTPPGPVIVSPGGSQTFIVSPSSGYYFNYVKIDGVSTTDALYSTYTLTFESVSSSHTIEVSFYPSSFRIWDGGGLTNNWSDAANWSGNATPESGALILFNATSVKNATIDASFQGRIYSITIEAGYTGTIGQYSDLTIEGSYSQSGGKFYSDTTRSFSVGGSFSITFEADTFKRFTGSGASAGDPYVIYDVYGLQAMKCNSSAYFKLNNNIDASSTLNWNWNGTLSTFEGFSPVGFSVREDVGDITNPFTGDLDGNYKTISGLYIDRTASYYSGLFGAMYSETGGVRNLTLEAISIRGLIVVGGLFGWNAGGTITNCHVSGALAGYIGVGSLGGIQFSGAMANSTSSGNVYAPGLYSGGLVGAIDSVVVSNCRSNATVSGGQYAGGLVGGMGVIMDGGQILTCESSGSVSANSMSGGLVGIVGAAGETDNIVGTVIDSRASGNVTGYAGIGGFAGLNYGAINDCSSTGNVGVSSFESFAIAGFVAGNYNSISRCYSTGNVTGGNVFGAYLYTAGFVSVNGGEYDYSPEEGDPIVKYAQATIDEAYSTGNITSASGLNGGFAGINYDGSIIRKSYSTGNVNGADTVGGFAGENAGTIIDSYHSYGVTGNLSTAISAGFSAKNSGGLLRCFSAGSVEGASSTGGLIGENTGTFESCFYDENTYQSDTGKGTKETAANMKKQATFSGWDFSNIWLIDENSSRPYLSYQAYTWTGSSDASSWTDFGNWTVALKKNYGYPYTGAQSVFFNSGSYSVTVPSGITVGRLHLGQGFAGTIGLGGTLTIDNAGEREGSLIIQNGTLNAGSGTINIKGDFRVAGGTFNCGTSTVNFSGDYTISSIEGANTFYTFECSASGKIISFEAGSSQVINGAFDVDGSIGKEIKLTSISPGTRWSVDPRGTRSVRYANVSDSNNVASDVIVARNSIDSGNNINWLISYTIKTWNGNGATNNWSDQFNWVGGLTPESTDIAVFNSTSSKDAVIDSYFQGAVHNISIEAQYVGEILQSRDLTVEGSFSQSGGRFISDISKIFTVGESFSITFEAGSFKRFSGGGGSAGDPYLIYDIYGLQAMKCHSSSYFKLNNDIDASSTSRWNWNPGISTHEGFSPVGFSTGSFGDVTDPFIGSLDGNNKTISDLWIERASYAGLFGAAAGATLKNINLSNVRIKGATGVGALCGWLDGSADTIYNCTSSGNIFAGIVAGGLIGISLGNNVSSCASSVNIHGLGGGDFCGVFGGLVGAFDIGALSRSSASGSIDTTTEVDSAYCGGLVGMSSVMYGGGGATIEGCSASGDVFCGTAAGGLVGSMGLSFPGEPRDTSEARGTIKDSNANGNIAGAMLSGGFAGVVAGENGASISNCYATGNVASPDAAFIGGFIGANGDIFSENSGSGATISDCYSSGSVHGAAVMGGFAGLGLGNTMRYCHATGAVTKDAAGGGGEGIFSYAIGGFVGLNASSIESSYSTGTVNSQGAGGFAGVNMSFSITDCYSLGNVAGSGSDSLVGGFAVVNGALISRCYSYGNVSGSNLVGGFAVGNVGIIRDSYAAGSVSGTGYVGGFAAQDYFDIGDGVQTGSIESCYASGSVTGSSNVGGLVGAVAEGSVIRTSYYDEGTGQSDTGKGTKETTANMRKQGTFAGWDFNNTWLIDENKSQPYLSYQAYNWTGSADASTWTNAGNWTVNLMKNHSYPYTGQQSVFINSGYDSILVPSGITVGRLHLGQGFSGDVILLGVLSVVDNGEREGSIILQGGYLDATDEAINVSGNFRNMGGIFKGSTSTVNFTGEAAVSSIEGSTTFYNFSCTVPGKIISFEAGSIQTMEGSFSASGSSGRKIKLTSMLPGTRWSIDPRAARSVTFVDVADSNNIAAEAIRAVSSVNSGNNINWFFGGAPRRTQTIIIF